MSVIKDTALSVQAKSATLLLELLTEELPPKNLNALSLALAHHLEEGLRQTRLWHELSETTVYATPRRLAVQITHIASMQPDYLIEKKGPALQAAFDQNQQPTKALIGFAHACGLAIDQLQRTHEGKREIFLAHLPKKGKSIDELIPAIIDNSIKRLPIAKNMRWGDLQESFVRPVHRIVLLYGQRVLSYKRWNIVAGQVTHGHRFLGQQVIKIKNADVYENVLCDQGAVVACFMKRRQMIVQQLDAAIKQYGVQGDYWQKSETLIDEVTALTEHPSVLFGQFDPAFLEVPQEALMVSMTQHQKYFPVLGAQGQLKPYFLMVTNMSPRDDVMKTIRVGNERVLRARMTDAQFFYKMDCKHTLASRVESLKHVTYLHALAIENTRKGSRLQDRVNRLMAIATTIAEVLNQEISICSDQVNIENVRRAGLLCKTDLCSELVGEFPELQGKAGYYYALADGEPQEVAQAIHDHYAPSFAGDDLPSSLLGCIIALADKLETMAGLFGVNRPPTGDKDPYGLRRAALGVIRMMLEKPLPFDLALLYPHFPTIFAESAWQDNTAGMHAFIVDRLRYYLRDLGYPAAQVESVIMANPLQDEALAVCSGEKRLLGDMELPTRLDSIQDRLVAIQSLMQKPQAHALILMGKRIRNILRQREKENGTLSYFVDHQYLQDESEKNLLLETQQQTTRIEQYISQKNYSQALQAALSLEKPLTLFFEKVMVMVEDEHLKQNRCALLVKIDYLINRVAVLSKL